MALRDADNSDNSLGQSREVEVVLASLGSVLLGLDCSGTA